MLQQIVLTKYHLQVHQQHAVTTPLVGETDQHPRIIPTPGITTMTIGIGTDSVDPDPTTHNSRYRSNSCNDSPTRCSRSFH